MTFNRSGQSFNGERILAVFDGVHSCVNQVISRHTRADKEIHWFCVLVHEKGSERQFTNPKTRSRNMNDEVRKFLFAPYKVFTSPISPLTQNLHILASEKNGHPSNLIISQR
jgi:hypothetical protein